MLKKKSKYFIFLFLFVLSIFYNIDTVNAGTYDCDNEKYQCRICTYTIDPNNKNNSDIIKNNKYMYVIKTNEKGEVNVKTKGDKNVVIDKVDTNKYIQSTTNTRSSKKSKDEFILQCPTMYYQMRVEKKNNNYKTYYVLTYKKQKDVTVAGDVKKSEEAPFEGYSNGKTNNQSKTSDVVTIQCKTTIKYETDTTNEVDTDTEYATVVVNGDNISITKLPDKYSLASDSVSSSITQDDYKDDCPNDVLVFCPKTSSGTTGKNECKLVKQSEVDSKYVDKNSNTSVNSTSLNNPNSMNVINVGDPTSIDGIINTNKTYQLTCDDISYLHTIWVIIWILSPILVIVFGSMDIFKAVIAGDVKKLEESRGKIPKRIISALVVAFIPTIISVAVGFSTNDDVKDTSLMYCIINGEGSSNNNNNNNNEDKNNSSSGKKSNTTSSNTYLNSACESACSYAKYGNTSLYDSCKSKCIKGYNNSCSSIPTSETVARDSCYKNYAKKYKTSN